MTDAEEKDYRIEYLEGKIRGLEVVRNTFFETLAGLQPTLSREIDLRLLIRSALDGGIAQFTTDARRVDTPFGKGAFDALNDAKTYCLGD